MKKRVLWASALSMIAVFLTGGETISQQKPRDGGSCLTCHSDAQKMKELGFPQFTITNEDARKQTKMPASCADCHLGNSSDSTKEGAHKGLLRLYYVKSKGFQAVTRDRHENYKPESLEPRGKNPWPSFFPWSKRTGNSSKIRR